MLSDRYNETAVKGIMQVYITKGMHGIVIKCIVGTLMVGSFHRTYSSGGGAINIHIILYIGWRKGDHIDSSYM